MMVDLNDFGKKIQQARKMEGYTQEEIATITGIPYSTYKFLEQRGQASIENIRLVLSTPRMKRYTLWSILGEVIPSAGQINPEIMRHLGKGQQLSDEELMALCETEQVTKQLLDLGLIQEELVSKLQAELPNLVTSVLEKYR